MTEIYYCKNENDMKRVAIHILIYPCSDSIESLLEKANIYCCDYSSKDVESCYECELDECLLMKNIEDKNVYKHVELYRNSVEYPCIVCIADTYYSDERVTICSIAEAKENTKYGYDGCGIYY